MLLILLAVFIFLTILLLLSAFGYFWSKYYVPFVPTRKKTIDKMIESASLKKNEVVYDLGCGDGRIVIAAENAGAKESIGIEVAPFPYLLARMRVFFQGKGKSKILFENFYKNKDILNADVLFAFLLTKPMEKVFAEIWPKMKPGSRIISHLFTFKGIEPDAIFPRTKEHGKIAVYIKK